MERTRKYGIGVREEKGDDRFSYKILRKANSFFKAPDFEEAKIKRDLLISQGLDAIIINFN